jgi:hypothetical protein
MRELRIGDTKNPVAATHPAALKKLFAGMNR